MFKKFASGVIVIGVLLLGIGFFQFFQTSKAQNNSLKDAYELLNNNQETDNVAKKISSSELFFPNHGEIVGILVIPKIEAELPIVEGTSEDELEKGVGHYKGTAYPTQQDQIVLSGHRDTVFRRMGELEIGDQVIIKLPYGSFNYEIETTKIVAADDLSVIQSTAPEEVLTITTCYPFSFIGNAPERYIINAKPVENN